MRLAVKVSEDMADKIDSYAKNFGMTKSAFIAYCIGTHIRTLEQQDGLISAIKENFNNAIQEVKNEQDLSIQN